MAVCRGVEPLLPDRQSGVIAVIPTDRGAHSKTWTCMTFRSRDFKSLLSTNSNMRANLVPPVGLEPTRLTTWVSKTHVSTNSTTEARWCRLQDLNPKPTDYRSVALPIVPSRQYKWSGKRGLNPQQPVWKTGTLPIELFPHIWYSVRGLNPWM